MRASWGLAWAACQGRGLFPQASLAVRCLQLFLVSVPARGQRLCARAKLSWQDLGPGAGTRGWGKRPLNPRMRELLKETGGSQFHLLAPLDMGWAEGLTGGGGQQDPGKGSRLGMFSGTSEESRLLQRVSEEESGVTPVGMAQKFGYSWNFSFLFLS